MTNTIVFTIPDNEWMSANDRYGHWAAKSRKTEALRTRAKLESLNAMRRGKLSACFGRVHVMAGNQYRASRVDPANAFPTNKALIDGMTDAGVFEDDSAEYVIGPDMRRAPGRPPKGTHTVAIMIEGIGGEKDG